MMRGRFDLSQKFNHKLNNSPLFKRFIYGFGWLLGGGVLSSFFMAISMLMIANYLGVKLYGVIALITSTVFLITGLCTFKTTEAVTKFLIDYLENNQLKKAGSLVAAGVFVDFLSAIAASSILIASSNQLVTLLFDSNEHINWLILFSITPILSFCYASSIAILRVADKFSFISAIDVFNAILTLLGNLYLILNKAEWTDILIWMIVVSGIRGIILLWSILHALEKLGIKEHFKLRLNGFSSEHEGVTNLMLNSTISSVLKSTHNQVDIVILGIMLGPSASGAYKFARNIIQYLGFPTNALFQVSLTEFVRLFAKKNFKLFRRVLNNLIRSTFLLTIFYCLFMWLLGPIVFLFLVGDSFYKSIDLLPIMVIGLSLTLISQYWQAALVANNNAGQVAASMAFALFSQIAILLLFLPIFGIQVAAFAFVLYSFVRAAWLYLSFNKLII